MINLIRECINNVILVIAEYIVLLPPVPPNESCAFVNPIEDCYCVKVLGVPRRTLLVLDDRGLNHRLNVRGFQVECLS